MYQAEVGRVPKNCTLVRVALLENIFIQLKVTRSHQRNNSSKSKNVFGKKATQVLSN